MSGTSTRTGATVVSAGTLALTGNSSLSSTAALTLTNSTFDISGATSHQTIGDISADATSAIILGNKNLTFTMGSDQTLACSITGTGGITKNGAATLTVSSEQFFTGMTTIGAGTLIANHTFHGSITANYLTILRGTGTINGNIVNNNGNVYPGTTLAPYGTLATIQGLEALLFQSGLLQIQESEIFHYLVLGERRPLLKQICSLMRPLELILKVRSINF